MSSNERGRDGRPSTRRADVGADGRSGTPRWTTIVLEKTADGWLATQTGVDIVGHAETAAAAAAEYCRRVDGDAEPGAGSTGEVSDV